METKYLKHSYYCEMDKMRHLLTKRRGICEACDALRDVNMNDKRNRAVERYDIVSDNIAGIYCKNSITQHARCTKKTYPSCACGKLVYNRLKGSVDDKYV